MKKFVSIFCVAALLAGVLVAATWRTGEGAKLVASATHTKYAFSNEVINRLTIINADSSNDVFCLFNSDTNTLISRIANNTALPLKADSTTVFDAQAHGEILDIEFATTNGTAALYLQGF